MSYKTLRLASIEAANEFNSYATAYRVGLTIPYDISDLWSIHSGLSYTDHRSNIELGTVEHLLGLHNPKFLWHQNDLKSNGIPISAAYVYNVSNRTIYPHTVTFNSLEQNDAMIRLLRLVTALSISPNDFPIQEMNQHQFYGLALVYGNHIDSKRNCYTEFRYNHAVEQTSVIMDRPKSSKYIGFSVDIDYAMSL